MLSASHKLLCLITWYPVKGTGGAVEHLGDRDALEEVEGRTSVSVVDVVCLRQGLPAVTHCAHQAGSDLRDFSVLLSAGIADV